MDQTLIEKLEKLAELRTKNILTEEEFACQKRILLSSLAESHVNPRTEESASSSQSSAGIDVSPSWREKFKLIEVAGPLTIFGYKNGSRLTLAERFKISFNIFGFLFGPIYYFYLGMHKKGFVIVGAICASALALFFIEYLTGINTIYATNAIAGVTGFMANYDYYRFKTKNEEMWNGFSFFGRKWTAGAFAFFTFLISASGIWTLLDGPLIDGNCFDAGVTKTVRDLALNSEQLPTLIALYGGADRDRMFEWIKRDVGFVQKKSFWQDIDGAKKRVCSAVMTWHIPPSRSGKAYLGELAEKKTGYQLFAREYRWTYDTSSDSSSFLVNLIHKGEPSSPVEETEPTDNFVYSPLPPPDPNTIPRPEKIPGQGAPFFPSPAKPASEAESSRANADGQNSQGTREEQLKSANADAAPKNLSDDKETILANPEVRSHMASLFKTIDNKFIKASFVEGSFDAKAKTLDIILDVENNSNKPVILGEYTSGGFRFYDKYAFTTMPAYPSGLGHLSLYQNKGKKVITDGQSKNRIDVRIEKFDGYIAHNFAANHQMDGYLNFFTPDGERRFTVPITGKISIIDGTERAERKTSNALSARKNVQGCEVRLKHPVPKCPHITYGPEDCFEELTGKAGNRVTSPATAHITASGHTYYCPSHEGCIDIKDLEFKGCEFTHMPRARDESPKGYTGHIFVN
ncbi:MAG: DUF2628 domain-containing protein [Methylocystis sp.]